MDGGGGMDSNSAGDTTTSAPADTGTADHNGSACNGMVNAAYEPDTETTSPTTPTKEETKSNGEFKSPSAGDGKVAEAVNLELVSMSPYSNSIPVKKESTELDMTDPYDEYFVPVNQHKKYIRGEKLYVTQDKRENLRGGKKKCCCGIVAVIVLGAIVAILVGVLLTQENVTPAESSEGRNYNKAGFGDNLIPTPPPRSPPSSPPQTTDMSQMYLKNVLEGELTIDNMVYSPALSEEENGDFKTLATSLEEEVKKALFDYQTLNNGASDIVVKVMNFRKGSVIVTYRVGWRFKEGIVGAQDPINVETLKMRLQQHIRQNDGFLYNYKIPIHSITTNHVIDGCQMENHGCSHVCLFNTTHLKISCACPSGFVLDVDMKTCTLSDDDDQHFGFVDHEVPVPPSSSHPMGTSDEEYQEFDHFHHSSTENTSEEGSHEHNNHDYIDHSHHQSTEDGMPNYFENKDFLPHNIPDVIAFSTESPVISSSEQPSQTPMVDHSSSEHSTPFDHSYNPSPHDTFNPGYEVIEPEQSYDTVTESPHHHFYPVETSSTASTEGSSEMPSSVSPSEVHFIPQTEVSSTTEATAEPSSSEKPYLSSMEESKIQEPSMNPMLDLPGSNVEFLPDYSTLADSVESEGESTTQASEMPSSVTPSNSNLHFIPQQSGQSMESTAEEVTTAKNSDEDAEILSENDTLGVSFSADNVTHLEMIDSKEHDVKITDDKTFEPFNNETHSEFNPTKGVFNVSEVLNHLPVSEIHQGSPDLVFKGTSNPNDMIFVTPPSTEKSIEDGNALETFREAKAANLTNSTSENPQTVIVSLVSTESPIGITENHSLLVEEMLKAEEMDSAIMAPVMNEENKNESSQEHEVPIITTTPSQVLADLEDNSQYSTSTEPELSLIQEGTLIEISPEKTKDVSITNMEEVKISNDNMNDTAQPENPPLININKIPDLEGPLPVETSDIGQNQEENHETDNVREDPVNVEKLLKESSNSLNSLDDDFGDKFSKLGKSKLIKDFNVKEIFTPINISDVTESSQNVTFEEVNTPEPIPAVSSPPTVQENGPLSSEVFTTNQPIFTSNSEPAASTSIKSEPSSSTTEKPDLEPIFNEEAFTTMHPLFTIKPESSESTTVKVDVKSSTTEKLDSEPIFSDEAFTTFSPMFSSSAVTTVKPEASSQPTTTPLIIDLMESGMNDDSDKMSIIETKPEEVMRSEVATEEKKTLEQEEVGMKEIDPIAMTDIKVDATTMKGITDIMLESMTVIPVSDGDSEHSVSKKVIEDVPIMKTEGDLTTEKSPDTSNAVPVMSDMLEDSVVKLLYNSSLPNATLQFKCPSGQTPCKDGNGCVSHHQLCDSEKNCKDESDEEGCEENKCLDNFQCTDGQCLKRHLVCDGIPHCSDKSDEAICDDWKCKFDELQCLPASKQCIPALWKCDGIPNCPGNVDEIGCKDSCENQEYLCPEGFCIPMEKKCDGTKDCANGEDELQC